MPGVIPGDRTGNPFAWAEINARASNDSAARAEQRTQQARQTMIGAEIDRQNSLVAPELAGRQAAAVAAAEFPYQARLAAMRGGSSGSGSSSSGRTAPRYDIPIDPNTGRPVTGPNGEPTFWTTIGAIPMYEGSESIRGVPGYQTTSGRILVYLSSNPGPRTGMSNAIPELQQILSAYGDEEE